MNWSQGPSGLRFDWKKPKESLGHRHSSALRSRIRPLSLWSSLGLSPKDTPVPALALLCTRFLRTLATVYISGGFILYDQLYNQRLDQLVQKFLQIGLLLNLPVLWSYSSWWASRKYKRLRGHNRRACMGAADIAYLTLKVTRRTTFENESATSTEIIVLKTLNN